MVELRKLGCASTIKPWRCGTRTCLGATTMSRWVICVFICYFIVALLSGLLRHDDLPLLSRSRTSCPGPVSCVLLFMLGSSDFDGIFYHHYSVRSVMSGKRSLKRVPARWKSLRRQYPRAQTSPTMSSMASSPIQLRASVHDNLFLWALISCALFRFFVCSFSEKID